MVVAGDPSGDIHVAPIIRTLGKLHPNVSFWGIGGPEMKSAGFTPLFPFSPFNRMGFLEVALHIRFFLKAKDFLIRQMELRRPKVVVCVDYPGFNVHIMNAAYKRGIPVIWYIAPMVWAWKAKRAALIGERASHIATIFPFEVDYFSNFKANVSFVGNPLVEAMENDRPLRQKVCPDVHRKASIAIVPGSRNQEVERILPSMIGAYKILKSSHPGLAAYVSRCGNVRDELYSDAIGSTPIEMHDGPLRQLLNRCDYAFITSGTATLEAALLGVPMVIAYRTSIVTYSILKHFVQIPFIGLPNIVANRPIVPECIQKEVTDKKLAETMQLFFVREFYNNTVSELHTLRKILGNVKPSKMLTDIIGQYI